MRTNRNTAKSFNAEELARRVRDWVNSSEGTAQLIKTRDSIKIATESAKKKAHVNKDLLRKPITL